MTYLVLDTETTGMVKWKEPSHMPNQPHICELAMLLCDDDGTNKSFARFLIEPDGWQPIEEEAFNLHGLTVEECAAGGVPLALAMMVFWSMLDKADTIVGHGITFDKRMLRISARKLKDVAGADRIKDFPHFCTKTKSRKIVDLPPSKKMLAAGRKTAKDPSLKEAYKHFYGEEPKGQHSAMGDVRASKAVYTAILAATPPQEPKQPEMPLDAPKEETAPEAAPSAPLDAF